ncbi:hypothetical protein MAR_028667 [Mya arenaria]|uniref:Uncharacterized protein n=1 Tax=Mya arenaria TaxID=6604 RepID=A0ABY7DEA1_MYAAR|nr:hypothetical protein MAR_028667 [Mya arenaria]
MEILKAFILLACSVYATCAEESSACAAVATEETNLYGTLSVLTDQQPNGTVLLRMTPNFDMNISVVWKYAFKYDSVASARTVTPNNTNFRLYENGALYLMLINASIDYNETYFWVNVKPIPTKMQIILCFLSFYHRPLESALCSFSL